MRRPISFPTPVAIPQLRAEPGDWIHIDPTNPDWPVAVIHHPRRSQLESLVKAADAITPLLSFLASVHPRRGEADHPQPPEAPALRVL